VVSLGNDTAIETGTTLLLDAGPGFSSYQWSTGDVSQTSLIDSAGDFSVVVTDGNGCTASDTIAVTLFIGIPDLGAINDESIVVYPNPANDLLSINLNAKTEANSKMLLTDLAGRILMEKEIRLMTGNNLHMIDVSQLTKGLYLLTIQSSEYSYTLKVIVQ
jgi:hypothetical protein